MAMGMKGFVSDIFDRVRHAPQDMATGFYMPSESNAKAKLKTMGTATGMASASLMLGSLIFMRSAPQITVFVAYIGSIAGLISYVGLGERGRDARKAMEHKPQ